MAYTTSQLEEALEVLWENLKVYAPLPKLQELIESNSVINEVEEFGAGGPIGLGLGKFGGHAIE
jgi:hypothetical protein